MRYFFLMFILTTSLATSLVQTSAQAETISQSQSSHQLTRNSRLTSSLGQNSGPAPQSTPNSVLPPKTNTNEIETADPYRWLEAASERRDKWLEAQRAFTESVLKPSRSRNYVETFFNNLWNKRQTFSKVTIGKSTYSIVIEGLDQPARVEKETEDGQTSVVFDASVEEPSGTLAIWNLMKSPDSETLVIVTALKGSIDLFTLYFIRTADDSRLEKIESVTNRARAWYSNNELLYSSRIGNSALRFKHRIGTAPSSDPLFGDPRVRSNERNVVSGDELWLVTTLQTESRVRKVGASLGSEWTTKERIEEGVGRIGDEFYFATSGNRDLGQIQKFRLDQNVLDPKSEVVVPEDAMVLRKASIEDQHLVLIYQMGATTKIKITKADGFVVHTLIAPNCCSIDKVVYDSSKNQAQIAFQSMLKTQTLTYDLSSRKYLEGAPDKLMLEKDGETYTSEVVMVTSENSTQIPVRITYQSELATNGQNPALIEGYGGFASSGSFHPTAKDIVAEFLARGGVYIAPALRGGDELGEPWHQNGAKEKKQNVFNDLIASAEYVIARGFTSPSKLAVTGASNGGLLVSAVVVQRPDLFKLAIPIVGVHDMMRKERLNPEFDDGWSYEYGSTNQVEDFKYIRAYAPLVNIKRRAYPQFLVVVGEQDSRVNPAHSYKLAAALQAAQTGLPPVLLSSYPNAGHWLARYSIQGRIAWTAQVTIWSTIYDSLGVTLP